MKILDRTQFTAPIHVDPGDTLRVIWHDHDGQVAEMETQIEEKQVLDTAVFVEYEPDEAGGVGLRGGFRDVCWGGD